MDCDISSVYVSTSLTLDSY